jgi:hypothetical protein
MTFTPFALAHRVQSKFIRNFRDIHCVWQVLLVREDKQDSIAELVLHNGGWDLVQEELTPPWGTRNEHVDFQLSLTNKPSRRDTQEMAGSHLIQHAVQLIPSFSNSLSIITVHDENQTLSILEVMPPERADLNGQAIASGTASSKGSYT